MTILFAMLIVLSLVIVLFGIQSRWSTARSTLDVEYVLRDEFRQARDESARAARALREELADGVKSTTDTLVRSVAELTGLQKMQLDGFGDQLRGLVDSTQCRLDGLRTVLESQLIRMQDGNETKLLDMRTTLDAAIGTLRNAVDEKLGTFQESNEKSSEAMRQTVEDKLQVAQDQATKSARELRDELASGLKANTDSVVMTIVEMSSLQRATLDGVSLELKGLTDSTQTRLDALRGSVDVQLKEIQEGNSKKLDEMRKTVDEQLHGTLEKRLTESFKVVGGHLEAVQRGLGEMQALATGVGDLKRVLSNVKARGTWAEVQLGSILEQVLTSEQYGKNVQIRSDSRERVEYAIRLPGTDSGPNSCVWLPIDSKFPQEAYLRLIDASEAADADAVQAAVAELARTLKRCAEEIHDKYLAPPQTTDFAILFLPTEGLYAEVLRQPDLANELQQTYRVVIAGPATLAALLNSLQMGFRTLAIEQRAGEVWAVLAAVKTEFGKFGDVLERLKRQLSAASKTIDDTGVRARAMARRLRDVEQLPPGTAADILQLPGALDAVDIDEDAIPAILEPAET